MIRLFPEHTYTDAPRAACFWGETVTPMGLPKASGEIYADHVVIGGGVSGLSTALHLAEAGEDVVLLEAQEIGWGASGRNGGFCCLGGAAATDKMLDRRFGVAERKLWHHTTRRAVDLCRDLIATHAIEADTHSTGETVMAHSQRAFDSFAAEAREIADNLGILPEILPKEALAEHGLNGPFFGAMTIPSGFGLNPAKFTQGLARAALSAGTRLFEKSALTRMERTSGRFILHAGGAKLTAKRVYLCTNGYSSDDLPQWMRGRYLPAQSNVLVTRPLTDDEIRAAGWSSNQMAYDHRFFLHYFRLMPDRRFLFGMRGGLFSSPKADAQMHHTIRRHFETMFPAWAHVETPYSWNGLLSLARDLTPYAGPLPEMEGAYVAMNYHGNGVAMGTFAGKALAQQSLGLTVDPLPAALTTPPRPFPLPPIRRVWLWGPYALGALMGG